MNTVKTVTVNITADNQLWPLIAELISVLVVTGETTLWVQSEIHQRSIAGNAEL